MDGSMYLGFTNGASRHTQNLASIAWVIHYPYGHLLVARGICIGPTSKNIAKYNVVINLLYEAIYYGIESLMVYLDSQLVVSQLNNVYHVRDPSLHRQFFRVILLQRSFTSIIFIDIPQSNNAFVDSIANQVLDWHINHSSH